MEESRWFGLRRNIANDLSVILWSAQLAAQGLGGESDAYTYTHLTRIRQRVHESAARLQEIGGNDSRLVSDVPTKTD